jgi:hypothetical protein
MSTLIESLAQDRHAARYPTAAQPRRQPAQARTGGVAAPREAGAGRIAGSARTRAGWLLIGLGLRLAMHPMHPTGQGDTPARRASLFGQ